MLIRARYPHIVPAMETVLSVYLRLLRLANIAWQLMQQRRHNLYLKAARRSTCLTQAELGALLSVSETIAGNVERGSTEPTFAFVLGCVRLFCKSSEQLFPYLYNSTDEALAANAVVLDERIRDKTDAKSLRKLATLSAMAKRTNSLDI